MKEITISDRLTMKLPDSYERVPLAGLTRWVEALRSGKYPQGVGFLHSEGKYCCLGVLCAVQGRPQQLGVGALDRHYFDGDSTGIASANPLYQTIGDYGYFPREVSGTLVKGDRTGSIALGLTDLNDEEIPFSDIITVLELLWYDSEVAP